MIVTVYYLCHVMPPALPMDLTSPNTKWPISLPENTSDPDYILLCVNKQLLTKFGPDSPDIVCSVYVKVAYVKQSVFRNAVFE